MDTNKPTEAPTDATSESSVLPMGSEVTDDENIADETTGDASVGEEPSTARPVGIAVGAAAVVAAALGLVSLSGTWLSTVLSERQRLIGQINHSGGPPPEQIKHIYGASWHTFAVVNGAFALTALLMAGLVLVTARGGSPWIRAVAWGALGLGVLGLLIACGMWFDVFVDLPTVPTPPRTPSPKGG
ncbi:hypothetical protein ACIQMR_38260 [Streptomyces sp. NPDC091376]|uniref:hypothetical protein n=1 Tax=Streptomyces sp. NPDC091376 TaxID=3365994 RepID=UPI0038278D6E